MWVRGLKRLWYKQHGTTTLVAPHVGAWIETGRFVINPVQTKSHPMWVRGLKLSDSGVIEKESCRTPCGCVD